MTISGQHRRTIDSAIDVAQYRFEGVSLRSYVAAPREKPGGHTTPRLFYTEPHTAQHLLLGEPRAGSGTVPGWVRFQQQRLAHGMVSTVPFAYL